MRADYEIRLPGARFKTTPVFDTYWRFRVGARAMFVRVGFVGTPAVDGRPILSGHHFTNAYRASDRVSQYLIRYVIYEEARRSRRFSGNDPVQAVQQDRDVGDSA